MTPGELVPTGEVLPNPFTGEVIDLDAPTEVLAKELQQLRDLDTERKRLVAVVQREIIRRCDFDAKLTYHFPGFDLTADGKGRREYNGEALKKVLEGLLDDGLISRDAARAAIERTVSFKARRSGTNALEKLGGDVAKRLKSAERRIPDEKRRVSIKPKAVVEVGGE